jgi:excinuclease UvrABC nuclease subunit
MTIQRTDTIGPTGFSDLIRLDRVDWKTVPDQPGVYIIYDTDGVLYVGMAGRDGGGNLRTRLKDHSSG